MSHIPRKNIIKTKPRHNATGLKKVKRGGAGAYGWGTLMDGYLDHPISLGELDERDPLYDDMDRDDYILSHWARPSSHARAEFISSLESLNFFKTKVRAALEEFLASADVDEFRRCVGELKLPVYLQEICAIAVKFSFDHSPDEREKIVSLLRTLRESDFLSQLQLTTGFRKLYDQLDELLIDTPGARALLREVGAFGANTGFLDKRVVEELEVAAEKLSDAKHVKDVKKSIAEAVGEYFDVGDLKEMSVIIDELKAPHLHFDVVKQLVLVAMGKSSKECELACKFIAEAQGILLDQAQIIKGFRLLLERVEDIHLDIPHVLPLLSCFVARGVADEALPPSFVLRVDLHDEDMGFKVLKQAQKLLKEPDAIEKMARIWKENGLVSGSAVTVPPSASEGGHAEDESKRAGGSSPAAYATNPLAGGDHVTVVPPLAVPAGKPNSGMK